MDEVKRVEARRLPPRTGTVRGAARASDCLLPHLRARGRRRLARSHRARPRPRHTSALEAGGPDHVALRLPLAWTVACTRSRRTCPAADKSCSARSVPADRALAEPSRDRERHRRQARPRHRRHCRAVETGDAAADRGRAPQHRRSLAARIRSARVHKALHGLLRVDISASPDSAASKAAIQDTEPNSKAGPAR